MMALIRSISIGLLCAAVSAAFAAGDDAQWWSLKPISRPAVPKSTGHPIDAFIDAKLAEKGLARSPQADRRTLIRRLCFDLIGLPPTPEEVDTFLADASDDAYEKLVDRLLASPRYGERWARHWLDVAHYGDTHGYDKDKLRPNAFPYRDYVIRALNDDKPYDRFVLEQLAGDVLFPGDPDGVVATGFIAAGPFDYVGQIEVKEGTLDKNITRNLDRDDMVSTTMNTFVSLTVQCARCHNHKFDPIAQRDYYSLQAVFAAVDRADRPYDLDPAAARRRLDLENQLALAGDRRKAVARRAREKVGPKLDEIDAKIAAFTRASESGKPNPAYGYHSRVEPVADAAKWVQIDLGTAQPIWQVVLIGAHDDFNQIGDGFGFPVRYKVELSNDPQFKSGVLALADHTAADQPNPGVVPITLAGNDQPARYLRITAVKLAPRKSDFIFALGEVRVLAVDGRNLAAGARIDAMDSIEATPRWSRRNLVDGYAYGQSTPEGRAALKELGEQRRKLLESSGGDEDAKLAAQIDQLVRQLKELPAPSRVFAAAVHFKSQGNFKPTEGKPREIHVLRRGSEKNPGEKVGPGTVKILDLPSRFDESAEEGRHRVALARWIVDPRNPLAWRSIVNRIWGWHFGRSIVDSPNDFGRMGQLPSHPELLDWLAAWFRDGSRSMKILHRLIVTSGAYRQISAASDDQQSIESGNTLFWRMNSRRLEAEAVRDAAIFAAGKLNDRMYGPGFQDFAIEKPEHSPHYLYEKANLQDPDLYRRSIYRFIVRSVPQPFMETLDCADPSQVVDKRLQTLTPLQALAMMNNPLMLRVAEHLAARVTPMAGDDRGRISAAYRLALSRPPTDSELDVLASLAQKQGLAAVCRLILNSNEFVFID